jgi:hypothetical protein
MESGEPMTPAQYRQALHLIGLSQQRAGLFLGVSKRTGQRYATGETEIPEGFARLLRLMVRLGLHANSEQVH